MMLSILAVLLAGGMQGPPPGVVGFFTPPSPSSLSSSASKQDSSAGSCSSRNGCVPTNQSWRSSPQHRRWYGAASSPTTKTFACLARATASTRWSPAEDAAAPRRVVGHTTTCMTMVAAGASLDVRLGRAHSYRRNTAIMGSSSAAAAADDDGKGAVSKFKESTAALRSSGARSTEDDPTATAREYLRDVLGMTAEVGSDGTMSRGRAHDCSRSC